MVVALAMGGGSLNTDFYKVRVRINRDSKCKYVSAQHEHAYMELNVYGKPTFRVHVCVLCVVCAARKGEMRFCLLNCLLLNVYRNRTAEHCFFFSIFKHG